MTGFRNVAELVNAEINGGYQYSTILKTYLGTSAGAAFNDHQVMGNFPRAYFYTGTELEFTPMPATNHTQIFHGGNVSPATKYLKSAALHYAAGATLTPSVNILCDYLGFYPLISMETTDIQFVDNSQFSLPRYSDGKGVKAFLVQVLGTNSANRFSFTYENQGGVVKTSQMQQGNSLSTGVLQGGTEYTPTSYKPFLDLAPGDTGIRRVISFTCTTVGSGLCALVLCKPLCTFIYNDASRVTPMENLVFENMQKLPQIQDGAYLQMISSTSGTPSGLISGAFEFVWG